jgi:hypothetical protein
MSVEDECVFCSKPATGETEIRDITDGKHYVLRLCEGCGKHFQVPPGTQVDMAPLLPPIPHSQLN